MTDGVRWTALDDGHAADHPPKTLARTLRQNALMQSTPTPHRSHATCDLGDDHKAATDGAFRVLPPVFHSYGGRATFAGTVSTVKCFEDNSLVKDAVESPGNGRVLVVDGGGSLRRALVGGNLAAAAAANGWAGIVVDGAVRDVAELALCDVGIRALGLIPLPTVKRNEGQRDVPVQLQGVRVQPGDWLSGDADGIVVLQAAPAHPAEG